MAWKKSHDEFGATFADSYWVPEGIEYKPQENSLQFKFLGYKDAAAKSAGEKSIGDVPASIINGALYATYFADNVLKEDGKSLLSQIYAYSENEMPEFAGAVSVDSDGNPDPNG